MDDGLIGGELRKARVPGPEREEGYRDRTDVSGDDVIEPAFVNAGVEGVERERSDAMEGIEMRVGWRVGGVCGTEEVALREYEDDIREAGVNVEVDADADTGVDGIGGNGP